MLTIADAESAYLKSKIHVERWQAQFLQQWYMPLTKTMMGQALGTLPGDEMEDLFTAMPDKMGNIVDFLERE